MTIIGAVLALFALLALISYVVRGGRSNGGLTGGSNRASGTGLERTTLFRAAAMIAVGEFTYSPSFTHITGLAGVGGTVVALLVLGLLAMLVPAVGDPILAIVACVAGLLDISKHDGTGAVFITLAIAVMIVWISGVRRLL